MTLENEILKDVSQLGSFTLRAFDKEECLASGMGPGEAIAFAISQSENSFSVRVGGALLCVWGYRRNSFLDPGVFVWLLTTEEVYYHKKEFLREGKRLLAALLEEFGEVRCYVWEGHLQAMRWLAQWGFSAYDYKMETYAKFIIMRRTSDG